MLLTFGEHEPWYSLGPSENTQDGPGQSIVAGSVFPTAVSLRQHEVNPTAPRVSMDKLRGSPANLELK